MFIPQTACIFNFIYIKAKQALGWIEYSVDWRKIRVPAGLDPVTFGTNR
jgi:hypothetical protein